MSAPPVGPIVHVVGWLLVGEAAVMTIPAGTVMNFVLGGVILKQKETLNGPTQRSCYP